MNMKITAASLAAAVMLTGCGDTSKVDKLIEQQESSSQETAATETESADTTESGETVSSIYDDTSSVLSYAEMYDIHAENDGFDVDLTILDASMTYAQVFDMVYNPSLYQDKKVRAKGQFAHAEDNGKDYFAVMIKDATACCAQGLEFELEGDCKFPDDYPEIDSEIIVWGDFASYEEGGYTYITLKNAKLLPAED
ncbi:hypothetical protein SAMN02910447_01314 [Ruminococcus sp. YE71]|uniref:hypothetical protein n=1 Tax=unclassified Ruminococcus TaxID=2608920 RepID=UPI0008846D8D|nr:MULTISPECIES: hypothetical protein [unclassified Ruminococcus]SDA17419.1 hypothetical protein SAMN02910446_01313 [Ruminococcus sp. YE78]SFW26783.1 hypothetical protein SAMN02910447_01314 [Ruminococcus sp. YE71]